ncbi:MAG: VWA domain-containing protein, partial [Candidatus Sungbacteria bacterium]|nr:VWA domain-containing protein [Candidatus Sungbacteria bacterium]
MREKTRRGRFVSWAGILDGLSHMERPWILLLIPVLLILLFFKRRKIFRTSSRSVFEGHRQGFFRRFFLRIFWALSLVLMFAGVAVGVVALAGPKSRVVTIVEKEVEGKIAVLIVDISGSIGQERRIDVMKAGNNAFLAEFCKEDQGKKNITMVGLVTFSDDAYIKASPSRDCNMIRRRIAELATLQGTQIEKGLWAGLKL